MYTLEREVESLRREVAFEKKKEDELMRERDVLAKKKEQVRKGGLFLLSYNFRLGQRCVLLFYFIFLVRC